MITSYDKSEVDDDDMIFNEHFKKDMKAYKKFKKWFQFSADTAGYKLFWLFNSYLLTCNMFQNTNMRIS